MEQQSGLRVSHEAIYTAIYALPRGELRRELIACLRQDKPNRGRKPKGSERRGKLYGMTNMMDRPEEIEGRLVPGHWEGGFIVGAGGASAIGHVGGTQDQLCRPWCRYPRARRMSPPALSPGP